MLSTDTEKKETFAIELAIRVAQVAKAALAMLGMSKSTARLQFIELVKQFRDLDFFLNKD